MRGAGIVVGVGAGNGGGQGVDAGGLIRQNLAQRQSGGHGLVERVLHLAGAGPDLLGDVVAELAFLVLAEGAAEVILLHGAQKVAVGDAAQQKLDLFEVHGLDRQGGVGGLGQDVGPAREADARRAVADVERDFGVALKGFAAGGGQPLAEGDAVALAMLDAGNADLVARGLHHEAGIGQADEGRVIGAGLDQRFGELGAEAGLGAVAVGAVIGDAETVLGDGGVECGHDVVARLDRFGEAQGGHGGLAPAHRLQGLGHEQKGVDARGIAGRAQVGVDRGLEGAFRIVAFFGVILRGDEERQAGIFRPLVGGVRAGHGGPHPAHRVEVILLRDAVLRGVDHGGHVPLPAGVARADAGGLVAGLVEVAGVEEIQIGGAGGRI